MIQEISDRPWQAEVRTQETRNLTRDIKRVTRRRFTAEEKIRIVLEGFRRDTPIRDLCRREGVRPGTYYAWPLDYCPPLSVQMAQRNPRYRHRTLSC